MARGELGRRSDDPERSGTEPPVDTTPSRPAAEAVPDHPAEPEPAATRQRPENDAWRGESDDRSSTEDRGTDDQDLFSSYPPHVRERLLKDDTLARLQYKTKPNDSPAAGAEPDHEPPRTQLPPPRLRERMANNPLFARDGWGRDEHDRDESDTVDARDQPPAEAGSQLSPKLNDKPAHNSLVSRDAWRQNRDDDSPAAEPEAQPDADVGDQSDVDRDRSQSDEDGDSQGQAESAEAREPSPDHDTDATDTPDHEFVDTPDDPRDLDAYRRIRETDDLDAVADNSGYRREVVEVAKENLFIRQHDVAVGPGEVRHGNFTPLPGVAPLWERVASGADLSDKQQVQFWSLLAHEYVEAKLMEAGLPYLQAESDAWDDEGLPKVERDYPTAHTVAPLSLQSARKDLLRLWKELFGIPRGDLRVAEDLSNLDEVVRVAKEGLGL